MKIKPEITLGSPVRSILLMNSDCESCGQELHKDKESGNYFCTNEECSQFIEYVDWTDIGDTRRPFHGPPDINGLKISFDD